MKYLIRRLVVATVTLPAFFGLYALVVIALVGFGAVPTGNLIDNFVPLAFGWIVVWAIAPQIHKLTGLGVR